MSQLSQQQVLDLKKNAQAIEDTANMELGNNLAKRVAGNVKGGMVGGIIGLVIGIYFQKNLWISGGLGIILGRVILGNIKK